MAENILIVDDEVGIVEFLEINLKKEGYKVLKAYKGEDAIKIVKTQFPDLVVLDIMLPDIDGFSVCKEIRSFSKIPIIMLTAKGEDADKIVGLEIGADDYLTKPFNPRELIARIKAVLRRFSPKEISENIIHFGELTLDTLKRKVTQNEKIIELSPKEYDLLLLLVNHPEKLFSREEILKEIWGYNEYVDLRTVDVHIKRLREKLIQIPSFSIQTIWGKGYKLSKIQS